MKISKERVVAVIPARLESSRLPNKPIADICGIPMIVHVLKRCHLSKTLDDVIVATDSKEIFNMVTSHHGKAIMTSSSHKTGTDRVAEAAKSIDADIIVNVQGDEALVNPESIDKVVSELIENPDINVGILINPFSKRNSPSDIKAVFDKNMDILYFSRGDIPSNARSENPIMYKAYHIVPFRTEFLLQYSEMEQTTLEKAEFNEYLRILENGYKIRAVEVDSDAVSVDTSEDLEFVRRKMLSDKYFPIYAH